MSRLLEKDDLLIVEGHANPDEIGRCAILHAQIVLIGVFLPTNHGEFALV
ncbi:hypothetical protein H6G97_02820 [Nostoc flagelliforme FACHB-838]|uniref:Uncharacterized protein n=1 Tax=Nostoc flagelliforme FACHB-838 TaxID=2692904 RepID=A0ABR8DGX8_9NOSO|nr:hypothetical protein [Nostoc flagelliforme FACHB-838]